MGPNVDFITIIVDTYTLNNFIPWHKYNNPSLKREVGFGFVSDALIEEIRSYFIDDTTSFYTRRPRKLCHLLASVLFDTNTLR